MTSSKIKIALGEFNIDWENKYSNQKKCKKIIETAKNNGAELVIFPEMTLTGFSMNLDSVSEIERKSETISFFKSMAIINRINIIFGVVLKDQLGKSKNLAIALNNKGKIIAKYQKIHPFSFANENVFFNSGKKIVFFEIKNVKFSIIICYDLRFPSLFELISKRGPADVIVVIANWPKKRIIHWDLLLKARSLDTQSYIIGVNRRGNGNGIRYNGQSLVYAPNGNKVLFDNLKLKLFCLDKEKVIKARNIFPNLKDKKYELY